MFCFVVGHVDGPCSSVSETGDEERGGGCLAQIVRRMFGEHAGMSGRRPSSRCEQMEQTALWESPSSNNKSPWKAARERLETTPARRHLVAP